MKISCPACHTRFHLDNRLFRGSAGMRVRCRKCGEIIELRNPNAIPSPTHAGAQSGPSPPRSKDPSPKYDAGARSSIPVPLDTAGSGTEQKRIGTPPGETAVPNKKVPEPAEKLTDDRDAPPRGAGAQTPELGSLQPSVDSTWAEKTNRRSKSYRLIPPSLLHKQSTWITAALLILLLGGGAAYLGFAWTSKDPVNSPAPGTESVSSGGETGVSHLIIRDVSAYYVPRKDPEKIFALLGTMENRGTTFDRGIRIRVTLFDSETRVIATNTFPVGDVFSEEELRNMDRALIEESMSKRAGEDPFSKEIPPGKSLPFMALFFDLQENFTSYEMTVVGAQ